MDAEADGEEPLIVHADGSRVDYFITVTVPKAFSEPIQLEKFRVWRPGADLPLTIAKIGVGP